MRPARGIHFGSYWMGENDVVQLMSRDLGELCALTRIDPRIYDAPSDWFEVDVSRNVEFPIRWLDRGRVYLSFPGTVAGHVNVKIGVFEAAYRVPVVTPRLAELERERSFSRGDRGAAAISAGG